MTREFTTMDIVHAMGVRPSTASLVAGLLNGKVNPDHCRSIEAWPPLGYEGVPPAAQKVLVAVANLLELEPEAVKQVMHKGKQELMYVDTGYFEDPTVVWLASNKEFMLIPVDEYINPALRKQR